MKVPVRLVTKEKTTKKKLNKTLVKVLRHINNIPIKFDGEGPYTDVDENFAVFEYHIKNKPIRITVSMIDPYIKKSKKSKHSFIKTGNQIKIKKKKKEVEVWKERI